MKNSTQFAIGEIVRIVEGIHAGAVCVVEEIVTEPGRLRNGIYSLYGWNQPNPFDKHMDDYPNRPGHWYFGDHAGSMLQTTGKIATAGEMENYRREKHFADRLPDGRRNGHDYDIDYIIANLGKTVKVPRNKDGLR